MKSKLTTFSYIITHDVVVDINFYVPMNLRYESDKTHDVDNLIKPILDALSGQEGILIDDTQVVSLSTRIIDSIESNEIGIYIRVDFPEDMLREKNKLYFVQYYKALCYPFTIDLSDPINRNLFRKILKFLLKTRKRINELLDKNLSYGMAYLLHPIQRDFHITRIKNKNFKIYTLRDLNKIKIIPKSFIDLERST